MTVSHEERAYLYMILICGQHCATWVFMQLWFQNLFQVEFEAGCSLLTKFLGSFLQLCSVGAVSMNTGAEYRFRPSFLILEIKEGTSCKRESNFVFVVMLSWRLFIWCCQSLITEQFVWWEFWNRRTLQLAHLFMCF